MIEKTEIVTKDILKQIKPGTTLSDIVTYSKGNLLPINRDIFGLLKEKNKLAYT